MGLKILLGLSFFDQVDDVKETLDSFSEIARSSRYKFVLGLETELDRKKIPDVKTGQSFIDAIEGQKWSECYLWDQGVNEYLNGILSQFNCRPFFDSFSYGAAVNRLIILTNITKSDYLIRVDPGTRCPEDFDKLVGIHIEEIQKGIKVISGQYTERLGIRDDFVTPGLKSSYYDLINDYTGINPCYGKQVTSGAALTLAKDGPPAIVFEGVRVWASDDGLYQLQYPRESKVQTNVKIIREASGVELSVSSYMSRVANMVMLNNIIQNMSNEESIKRVHEFLKKIDGFIFKGALKNGGKFDYDIEIAFAGCKVNERAILDGYEKFDCLKENWNEIVKTILANLSMNLIELK